jgi:hypothetical protein
MMLLYTAGGTVWKEMYLEHLTCFSMQGNCTVQGMMLKSMDVNTSFVVLSAEHI